MSPSDGYGCVTWHSIGSALRDLYGEAIASKPLPRVLERPHTHTEDGRNAGQRVSHVKLLTVLVVGFSWNVITKPRPAAGNSSLGGSCCSRWLRCMPMRHGSIIAISSWSGLVGIAGAAEYAVSKSAVRSHESVALDCAEQWLAIARTQSIPRPYILTPMWEPMLGVGAEREERMKAVVRDTPLLPFGRLDEVAALAVLLASDAFAASSLTCRERVGDDRPTRLTGVFLSATVRNSAQQGTRWPVSSRRSGYFEE
jgi:hypothetical protein